MTFSSVLCLQHNYYALISLSFYPQPSSASPYCLDRSQIGKIKWFEMQYAARTVCFQFQPSIKQALCNGDEQIELFPIAGDACQIDSKKFNTH
jgi:hypothetical protein